MHDWSLEAQVLDTYCQTPRKLCEIMCHLDLNYVDAREIIQYHRHNLSGTAALVQWRSGEESYYEVTGDPEKITQWVLSRLREGDTRLMTILAVAQVAARVTSGRSTVGRMARKYVKHIGRLVEDIEEIVKEMSEDQNKRK